jgi:hypothetical protein
MKKSNITMSLSVSRSRSRSRSRCATPDGSRVSPSCVVEPDSPLSVSSRGSTNSMKSRESTSTHQSQNSSTSCRILRSHAYPDAPRGNGTDETVNCNSRRMYDPSEKNSVSSRGSSKSLCVSLSHASCQSDVPFEGIVDLPSEASISSRASAKSRSSISRTGSFRGRRPTVSTRGRQLTRAGSVSNLQAKDSSQETTSQCKATPSLRVVKRSDSRKSLRAEELSTSSSDRYLRSSSSSSRRKMSSSCSNLSWTGSTPLDLPQTALSRRISRYKEGCGLSSDASSVSSAASERTSSEIKPKSRGGSGNLAKKARSVGRSSSSRSLDDGLLSSASRSKKSRSEGPRTTDEASTNPTLGTPNRRHKLVRSLSVSDRSGSHQSFSSLSLLGEANTPSKGTLSSRSSHGERSSGYHLPRAILPSSKYEDESEEEPDFFD